LRDLHELLLDNFILYLALAYGHDQPAVICSPGHFEDPAHLPDTELARVLPEEPIDHFGVLEKMSRPPLKAANSSYLIGAVLSLSNTGKCHISVFRSFFPPPEEYVTINSQVIGYLVNRFTALVAKIYCYAFKFFITMTSRLSHEHTALLNQL
jgi:hypothetical protein